MVSKKTKLFYNYTVNLTSLNLLNITFVTFRSTLDDLKVNRLELKVIKVPL